jgi:hypothetical protein
MGKIWWMIAWARSRAHFTTVRSDHGIQRVLSDSFADIVRDDLDLF